MAEQSFYTPFRFRDIGSKTLITNEAGDFGIFDNATLPRFFRNELLPEEKQKLESLSIILNEDNKWRATSLDRHLREKYCKKHPARSLSYIIVVPTLRCNLSCSYCQVSRAPLTAPGFDWGNDTLSDFEKFLSTIDSDQLKLEFQGGEATLRPDLLERIMNMCRDKFEKVEFVICSNLVEISRELEAILEQEDVLLSTSIDGGQATMTTNRTNDESVSAKIIENFKYVSGRYGHNKIAALPTITEENLNDPRPLIDLYRDMGFANIFLRPVNYMGFARKQHPASLSQFQKWNTFYYDALEYIGDINGADYFEEFFASMCVRNIFGRLSTGFVDFKSPSNFLDQYCVIDFDGKIYPSDEARMLSRSRHVDLAVGSLKNGIDEEKVAKLNFGSIHHIHEDCIHCAYLPYCGNDPIDDLSRYGRVDIPKYDTWFCNRQTQLFDFVFSKILNHDVKWMKVFLKWIFRSRNPPVAYEIFE